MVPIHNAMLLGQKYKWNLVTCDNMDGPREYYAKWKKFRDKYCIIWLICGIHKRKQTYTSDTHKYREQTGGS